MKIIGLDTETTDVDADAGARIIELALLTYDLDSRALVERWVQRFDPECPIAPKAQEVHGIAYSDLVGQPKFGALAGEVSIRLAGASLVVAHNMAFDAPFIAAELNRCGAHLPSVETLCTMEGGRWACFDGKSPKLGELCFALGVPYDPAKAHGAGYDVEVMMACFFKGLDRGFFELPRIDPRRPGAGT